MIDDEGFRSNVGIILSNAHGQLLWAKRLNQEAWQFPQGGVHEGETPEEALFRELAEEIGLTENDVSLLGQTRNWLHYRIPERLIRAQEPVCIGQKQLWFLLRLESDEKKIHFDSSYKPEFDGFQWVSYWYPLRQVVSFKREVYRRALKELLPYLSVDPQKSWRHKPLNHLLEN